MSRHLQATGSGQQLLTQLSLGEVPAGAADPGGQVPMEHHRVSREVQFTLQGPDGTYLIAISPNGR